MLGQIGTNVPPLGIRRYVNQCPIKLESCGLLQLGQGGVDDSVGPFEEGVSRRRFVVVVVKSEIGRSGSIEKDVRDGVVGQHVIVIHQRGDASDLRPQKLAPSAPPQSGRHSLIAIPSGGYYVAELDNYETQILRFQTPPYETDTIIVGPVTLRLMLSASAIDTYVVARLSDLAPDGKRTKLAWGWLLASHRTVDPARSNPTEIVHDHRASAAKQLTPGEPAELLFSLTPIANMFKPGHVMQLEIAARPELLLSEKGEGFDMFSWEAVPYRCRNTIHTGAEAGSYLEVMTK